MKQLHLALASPSRGQRDSNEIANASSLKPHMLTCPACRKPGITLVSRFLTRLYEPIACRYCGTRLIANSTQRVVALFATLLFVTLGLSFLAVSTSWLLPVVASYAAVRFVLVFAYPLSVEPCSERQRAAAAHVNS